MLRLVDSVLRGVALALFTLFVAAALPQTLWRSVNRLGFALSRAGESPEAARRRALGPEVAAAYERLRGAIPADGAYLLVDGGSAWQGSTYWVRYQLAPRKARLAGSPGRLPSAEEALRLWPPGVRYAVVALPEGTPPELMEKGELVAFLERAQAVQAPDTDTAEAADAPDTAR